jgi:hypothetical protein
MSRLSLINDIDTYTEEEIVQGINDINEIQKNLSEVIYNQNDRLNSIEDNMSLINNNLEEANNDLKIADSYYFSYTPVFVGGLIGGLIMGPIGFKVGVSIPTFATFGTFMGGLTGYKLQKF